ncbi:MAG TPA: hypothetical protein VME46_13480 [Acidimicrobiales bacterium]|nr:hypothetical protein [Acidimicrobiales bacterium]
MGSPRRCQSGRTWDDVMGTGRGPGAPSAGSEPAMARTLAPTEPPAAAIAGNWVTTAGRSHCPLSHPP